MFDAELKNGYMIFKTVILLNILARLTKCLLLMYAAFQNTH